MDIPMKSCIVLCYTIGFIFLFQACREFENNSFNTYVGYLMDAEGRPVSGVELFFTNEYPQQDSLVYELPFIYRQRTNHLGEFRFVVPSRTFDEFYVIWVEQPYLLKYEQFDQQFQRPFINPQVWERDKQEGVILVEPLTLIIP